jgi:hypothetical protein
MENIFTYITKSIDTQTSFLYDRREIVSAPLWSTNTSSLTSIFTSSNQHHHQRIYYMDVFSNSSKTSSLDVEFSLAYGHYSGKGSSTGSYGLLTGSAIHKNHVSESRAIYSQYKNYLLDLDKIKYTDSTDSIGSRFKFYGMANSIIGNYFWGKEYYYPFISPWQQPNKINIPGIVSNQLALAKSISIGKSSKYTPNASIILLVTNSNELIYIAPILIGLWNTNTVYKLSKTKDWESVSVGHGHLLALKNDGSLWVSGDNEFGQLGLGYTGNEVYGEPIRLGTDTWKYVCAGSTFSFGIKTDGTLWSWGQNLQGQLGLGDLVDRNIPTEVTSYGTDNWTMIATSNAENFNEYQTVMGIQDDGTLWGWGDNNSGVISIGNPDTTIPYQLGVATDWEKISVGKAFAVAIKGGALKSWGSNDENGTLGIGSNTPSSYPFNAGIQTPSSDTDWIDVSCGPDFVLAIKSNKLYGWGNDRQYQLGRGIPTPGQANPQLSPIRINNKVGWTKVETAPYMSVGIIPISNGNSVSTVVSDDIYAINISRQNFRDRIESGNWQLTLSAVDNDNVPNPNNTITLIDETVDYIGTSKANPTYTLNSLGGEVYGVYSGSLETGIDIDADKEPYGLFFPDNGVIILNGEMLYASASIVTRRTDATSSGAFSLSSNAEMLFTSISASMSAGFPFKATTSETKMPTYCFIRINNYEFNYTLNPSYFDVVNDGKDSLVVKDKLRMSKFPFVYITTIGLYNDNGDLLAVAKLSKPIKKTFSDELVIKIKLEI